MVQIEISFSHFFVGVIIVYLSGLLLNFVKLAYFFLSLMNTLFLCGLFLEIADVIGQMELTILKGSLESPCGLVSLLRYKFLAILV